MIESRSCWMIAGVAGLSVACSTIASAEQSACSSMSFDKFSDLADYLGPLETQDIGTANSSEACLSTTKFSEFGVNESDCTPAEFWVSDELSDALIAKTSSVLLGLDDGSSFFPLSYNAHSGSSCSVIIEGHNTYALFQLDSGEIFVIPASNEAIESIGEN